MTQKFPYRLGVDLGGTKIEAVLLAPDKSVIDRRRIPTPRIDSPGEYECILDAIHDLIDQTTDRIPAGTPMTIGFSTPGSLDPATGLLYNSNTISLNRKPLKSDIEQRLGRPVGMKNDANCFALAESLMGAAQGWRTVFGVIMGTGCGGGICLDNRIHEGRNGMGGEWGHISIDPAGDECYCGNRGCIETKISGGGMERAFYHRYGRKLTMREIVDGARKNDPECVDAFDRFLDDFGRALGGLISILDPDAVVLGGGLSNINELYDRGLALVKHYAFHYNITTPILKNQLGDSAGVFGAALIGQ